MRASRAPRERASPVRQSDGLVPWRARTQRPIGCQAVLISTVSDARQKLAKQRPAFSPRRQDPAVFTADRLSADEELISLLDLEDGPVLVPRKVRIA